MRIAFSKKSNDGKAGILLKVLLTIFILFLMLFMFMLGMYLPGNNEVFKELAKKEVVYLGEVSGKYSQADDSISQNIKFQLYWDVWDSIKKNYVNTGKISEKELFYGSLQGMVESLGDPYTVFMNPEKYKEFNEGMSGKFEGIGAEVGIKDGILTIIAPLDGMPAQKAGLLSGDKVFDIDGESTKDMTLNDAVSKIRGKKGTDVVLNIFRKGVNETKKITITRGVITIKSVRTDFRDDGIAVLKIINFNDNTLNDFNDAVRDIESKNCKGLIIDLRDNPGGYLSTSVEIASEWIENGPIVIESFGDHNEEDNIYNARGIARLKDYPTVILINQGSASASEILAGAMRDYDKAIIVGSQSYGKGSVQTLKTFKDGSSVKITIAKWLTPNRISISDKGITPDVVVDYTMEDYENDRTPQMDKAIEVLNRIISGEKISEMKAEFEAQASSTEEIIK